MSTPHDDSVSSPSADDAQTPLRPSWLLVGISLFNMAAGVVTASISLVGLELLWPNPISYSLLLVFGIGLVTIAGQYAGTFRGNIHGALLAAGASSGCYSMSYLAIVIHSLVSGLGPQAVDASGLSRYQSVIWPAIMVVTLMSLWLNGRWAWKLKKRNEQNASPTRLSISLREMFAFCFLLGLILLPASFLSQQDQSLYRAEVTAAEAPFPVPDAAQAIQYQRGRTGLIVGSYEVDEETLRRWLDIHAAENLLEGYHLKDIATGPIPVTPPDPAQTPLLVPYAAHTVNRGMQAYWHVGDLYHFVTYDRDTGIAYYEEVIAPKED
ncbi:hypothetical protein AB1K70_26215 [Bremerella sp. JC770]|uniref:hypothetical protein n=1 Tax=Bremerella sp. JC770 TaxID=3232137 RepID=UPI003457D62C